jgi:hypothetical protein
LISLAISFASICLWGMTTDVSIVGSGEDRVEVIPVGTRWRWIEEACLRFLPDIRKWRKQKEIEKAADAAKVAERAARELRKLIDSICVESGNMKGKRKSK